MTIHYPNGQGPQRPAQSRPQPAVNFADRGMSLEAEINASNAYYLATNQAVIHKKPTPIQFAGRQPRITMGSTKGIISILMPRRRKT